MACSLFIGRWQPFHAGHCALIQSVLDEGREVCVAVRDTPMSEDNPYSAEARVAMIRAAFPGVAVIVIPDIDEVVHGRKVGWAVREIALSPDIEAISGTEIRRGDVDHG
jgi:adenylylsulfate kinase